MSKITSKTLPLLLGVGCRAGRESHSDPPSHQIQPWWLQLHAHLQPVFFIDLSLRLRRFWGWVHALWLCPSSLSVLPLFWSPQQIGSPTNLRWWVEGNLTAQPSTRHFHLIMIPTPWKYGFQTLGFLTKSLRNSLFLPFIKPPAGHFSLKYVGVHLDHHLGFVFTHTKICNC